MPPSLTHICPLFDPNEAKKLPYAVTLQSIGAAVQQSNEILNSLLPIVAEIKLKQEFWLGNGRAGKVQEIADKVERHDNILTARQIEREQADKARQIRRQQVNTIVTILGSLTGIGGFIRYILPWLLR